ncbi:hypothetical protein Axi01nite_21270 [Actinoplanes xinjiangensis]|nr:hypothetical protein Axi01nite_21270 [Actinoplanes xinjiangensis]
MTQWPWGRLRIIVRLADGVLDAGTSLPESHDGGVLFPLGDTRVNERWYPPNGGGVPAQRLERGPRGVSDETLATGSLALCRSPFREARHTPGTPSPVVTS